MGLFCRSHSYCAHSLWVHLICMSCVGLFLWVCFVGLFLWVSFVGLIRFVHIRLATKNSSTLVVSLLHILPWSLFVGLFCRSLSVGLFVWVSFIWVSFVGLFCRSLL